MKNFFDKLKNWFKLLFDGLKRALSNFKLWLVKNIDFIKKCLITAFIGLLCLSLLPFSCNFQSNVASANTMTDGDKDGFPFTDDNLNLIMFLPSISIKGRLQSNYVDTYALNIPLLLNIERGSYDIKHIAVGSSIQWVWGDIQYVQALPKWYAVDGFVLDVPFLASISYPNFSRPILFDVYAVADLSGDSVQYLIPPYTNTDAYEYEIEAIWGTVNEFDIPNLDFYDEYGLFPCLYVRIYHTYSDEYNSIQLWFVQSKVLNASRDTFIDNLGFNSTDYYPYLQSGTVNTGWVTTFKPFTQIQYNRGVYDYVYTQGYNDNDGVSNPLYMIGDMVNSFLSIPFIGNVTFGTVFQIGFGLILLGFVIKIFLGG